MQKKKLLVIFKTHLDIGFTDFSANVTEKYMKSFLPGAVELANELRKMNASEKFVWTTGSWLISEYLRTHSEKDSENVINGIKNGDISWHALPFTTHTELMNKELFEYGISLSKELDSIFGKKTVAAKMTDVPGHTKAIIPCMKNAGIEFLHIGVNPASSVPEVPALFRWQADSGETINVMYQKVYGAYYEIPGTDTAVYFAHASDNQGVPSVNKIKRFFKVIRERYPEYEIQVGDLNDLAYEVRKIEDTLPMITDEIGDSWIHGVGTDPRKVFSFRGLERLWETIEEPEDYNKLARGLIMIPEHTWGLDEKKHLNDNKNYSRIKFEKVRNKPNYKKMESSWEEQRNYLYKAIKSLSPQNREKAEKLIADATREPLKTKGFKNVYANEKIRLGSFELSFNVKGEINFLKHGQRFVAFNNNRLGIPMYECFGSEDYDRFYKQYIRPRYNYVIPDFDWTKENLIPKKDHFDWAREDFTKPGLRSALKSHIIYTSEYAELYFNGEKIAIKYHFNKEAYEKFGCPESMDCEIAFDGDKLFFDLAWFNKPANRIAEALWFGFSPIAENKRISKLGQRIDPKAVVDKGQCRLHATDYGVIYDNLTIESPDTALVAPQEPSLLNFTNEKPLDSDPVYFNLYNNVWGTNFPMWFNEDARFRFILNFE